MRKLWEIAVDVIGIAFGAVLVITLLIGSALYAFSPHP